MNVFINCAYEQDHSQKLCAFNSLMPIKVLRNEPGSARAHNGNCPMTARPRGNFVMAWGEEDCVGSIYCVIIEFVISSYC